MSSFQVKDSAARIHYPEQDGGCLLLTLLKVKAAAAKITSNINGRQIFLLETRVHPNR